MIFSFRINKNDVISIRWLTERNLLRSFMHVPEDFSFVEMTTKLFFRNKVFYPLFILLLSGTIALAQDVKVVATVNNNPVAVGEVFEITFSINGNADKFNPPSFGTFRLVGGPNQSQSMSMVNGVTTSSVSVSYDLVASKEGEYTIGGATIVANGRQLTSNSIKIKVVKGKPGVQNNAQQQQPGGQIDDEPTGNARDIGKNLFIRAVVDKTHVYLGEQLTVTYRLYTRVPLVGSQVDAVPDFNNFYNQDIKDLNKDQNVQWKPEIINGERFNTADIKQTILYPQHSGDIPLDPLAMTFVVRQMVRSRDPIENFFGGASKDVNYKIKSAPVVIHVKPLPEAGKPTDFSGAVGRFAVNATVDKNEVKANEAINYKIKVTGSGNIKLIQAPVIAFPADFEKYDPKVVDTVTANVNGTSGSRIFNYLLIPRHEGNFNIEPLTFSYFDPKAGRYVTLNVKGYAIKVNKGVGDASVSTYSSADKQDVKVLDKDIRYIKTNSPDLYKKGDNLYGSAAYYVMLAMGPLLFLLALAYRRWDEKNNSDLVKVKSRKASKIAAKHLANAEKALMARNTKLFYEDIAKGIYGYLSDKFNIPIANLDKETIIANLKARSTNEALIGQVVDTLDMCEMARFAPVSGIAEQEVFEKAKGLIDDIENKV